MIRSASIEPANPVNAELSWNMVKKGSRSATRRPRKINRSLNIVLQDIDKGSEEEPSVAESEELGLAVFGHRSEKIDHLPIKKRRTVQKSPPSPPRVPFDQWFGEAGSLVDDLVLVKTSMPTDKSFANKEPSCSEDSYGIELLAAAACNASLIDEFFNVKEVKVEKNFEAIPQANASISVTALKGTIAATACNTGVSDETFNVKAVKVEDKSKVLPQSDASINATSVENINSQKQISLLKDGNSVAHDDSREKGDYLALSGDIHNMSDIVCSQKQNSLFNDFNSAAIEDPKDQNNSSAVSGNIHDESDIEAGKGSSSGKNVRLNWDLNTVMDDWELPSDNMSTDSPRNGLVDEGLLNGETKKSEASAQHASELLICPSEAEASGSVMDISKRPDRKMGKKVAEDRFLGSDLQLGQTLAVEKVQLGKQDDATVDKTISVKTTCDVVRTNNLSHVPKDTNITKLMETTLDVKGPCKLEKSGPSLGKGGDLVEKIDAYVPLGVAPRVGSSSDVELKKLDFNSCKRTGEAILEFFLDDGDVSDYSPGGHYHFARIEKLPPKYQSGCESPVEDGEFRESIAYSWQENEEEEDRDCVDYDTDDKDAVDDFSIGNHSVSKAGSSSNQINSNEKLAEKFISGRNDFVKELNRSAITRKSSGWDQIPIGCERVAKTIESNDMELAEIDPFDSTQKLGGKGSLEEKVVSRPIKGKFSTLLQRLSGSGEFDEKDTRDGQRSSGACFKDGLVYRFDKYLGRDRFVSRVHDGSQKNNQDGDVSHNWDSRNSYQNGYHRGGSNPRIRSSNIPDANDDDLAYDNHRLSNGNNYRGGYRPFVRRRSLEDDHNSPKMGNFSTRDDSHNRSRGGSGFYRRRFVQGSRDEFHDHIADPSNRRKYNNSPVYNRDNSFSRPRKSSSQSRSRSPIPWHLQKERNGGRRQISRSPDFFRSDGRMGRNRMCYEDSKFSENENGFSSRPRKGYFNDRNSGSTCYKDRDSPGRVFGHHRQRFGSNGTDDGGFRPRLNSERFSEHNNNNNNNSNYEGYDCERMRYNNNKHEIIRRVRHSETGGADCLKRRYTRKEYTNNKNNSCIKITEKSDELGNSWEEGRLRFKHGSERIYSTSSRPSGICDYEDEIPVSRG